MDKLLTFSYYFTTRPDPNFQFTKLAIALVVILFAASFIIKLKRKKLKDPIMKKMLKRYPSRLSMFGSLLLFLLVVREAGLPYLSMRIWWFLLGAFFLYWALKNASNFNKEYKRRATQAKSNASRSKYLPRKKKK